MALLNPLQPLVNPSSMFEDLLRGAMSPLLSSGGSEFASMRLMPRIDVCETGDAYEIEVELPGVDPDAVNVTLTGDTLTIQGEKSREEHDEGDTYHITERSYGMFRRDLSFPSAVDANAIEASHVNGILSIRVPKAAETKPRKIDVRAGGKGQKQLDTVAKQVSVGAGGDVGQEASSGPSHEQAQAQSGQSGQKRSK